MFYINILQIYVVFTSLLFVACNARNNEKSWRKNPDFKWWPSKRKRETVEVKNSLLKLWSIIDNVLHHLIQCNYCEKLFIKLLQTFLQSWATFLSNAKLRCDFVRFCHQNGKRIKLESRNEKLCGWKILLLDKLDGGRKINWVSSSTFASSFAPIFSRHFNI